MSEFEVKSLMESATSEADWNAKCDEVKQRCGGYPQFWYPLIIQSGLASRVMAIWGSNDKIHAVYFFV